MASPVNEEDEMSFVKTVPETMNLAAGQLAGIGEGLTAQNSAAASATTAIAPAGTDPVSQVQAALFSTYGSHYQAISTQAKAVHQQLVHALAQSATSYSAAESTNQSTTATSSLSSAIQYFLNNILGVPSSGSTSLLSGNAATIGNIGTGNWASAASDLLGLAGGGLIDFPEDAAADAVGLAGYEQPMPAIAGVGVTPMVGATLAQSATVGELSVPPSWGVQTAAVTNATPVQLASASMATAEPASGMRMPTAIPAAMAAAAGNRAGGSFGAPRYGHKPTVMPKNRAI